MKKIIFALIVCLISYGTAGALELDMNKGRIITLPSAASHVYIANPAVADVDVRSPTRIYIFAVGPGETTIHAVDDSNETIFSDVISVKSQTGSTNKVIKQIFPGSDVRFLQAGTGLVMTGTVDNPQQAEYITQIAENMTGGSKLINMLKIRGSDQVMLRVRIAEVARSELKNFGINLGSLFTKGSFSIGLLTGRAGLFNPATTATTAALDNGDNNLSISGHSGSFDITGVIDALETDGLVKTLAEPNLTAKSGSPASFLAGGEFPIPVPGENNTIAIQYKTFGVKLNFTPTVLSEERISLFVEPEVSTITSSTTQIAGNNVPTLATRRTSTTVELGSGESFAIAGLLQNENNNNINKFPWLGDVPVLGTLFRSHQFSNNETELVIIVTPYVVSPVKDPGKLLTPTEKLELPSDFERILLGHMSKAKKPGREDVTEGQIAKYKLNGNAGFNLGE